MLSGLEFVLTGAIVFLASLIIASIPAIVSVANHNKSLKIQLDNLINQKKSSEVRLGQISEQLAPFIEGFNHDPKRAHFIGQPIDYVVFNEDEVVFVEVKSGKSRLTKVQKDIKDLIGNGKVRFETMRIDGVDN